jgi:hypothetical protein
MTDAQERGLHEAIVAFAGIGTAIDAPLRQYSSGMIARLTFAIAIHCPGEVVLIDELLAVGDEEFRQAALDAIEGRRVAGAAVLFVSHELALVEQVCRRAVQLGDGRLVADGNVRDIIDAYGGNQWAGGVHDAVGGIRLLGLQLAQRQIALNGSIEAEGTIVVERANPHGRLELSYRAVPVDRTRPLSRADRNVASFFLKTVEPPGGVLAAEGTFRFRARVPRNPLSGGFDVVLAAIDDQDDTILAETWQEVVVGHTNPNGLPGFVATVDWDVERIS